MIESYLKLPASITVGEQIVGEGFATEPNFIPTETKVWLVRELINAGSKFIQVSNLANPRFEPQFRDCEELYRQIEHPEGVTFVTPTPDMRALQKAIELKKAGHGPDIVSFPIATTDAFNKSSLGKTTEEQWKVLEPMVTVAHDAGLKINGYIAGVWTCVRTGTKIPRDIAYKFADKWVSLGADMIAHSEGTTGGEPTPSEVYEYFSRVLDKYPDPKFHKFHLHDAYGWGLACYIAAMHAGVTLLDTCLGGVRAGPALTIMDRVPIVAAEVKPPDQVVSRTGLIPSEDFVSLCDAMGIQTGLDVEKILNLGRWVEQIVGRRLWSTRLRW